MGIEPTLDGDQPPNNGFEDRRDPTHHNCGQLVTTDKAGSYEVPFC